jgi:succinate dehydrogenase / fumarate reductase cytochrome b subunit
MAALDRPVSKSPRPVYLNLLAIRLPLPGLVSILHRVSGALLFLIGIPLLLCAVQASLASPESYAEMRAMLVHPLAKLTLLALAWAYIHHFLAGVRHLVLDLDIGTELSSARRSSAVVMVLAILLTVLVALRLW